MPSYNKVILMGNLTRDPEMRYLPSNTAVAQIGLAVNDRWKDKQSGEWKDKANFIDCEAFGNTAENINKFFSKGRPILIEGKLRLDQWEDQQGNKRSKLKVVVDRFEFVGSRDDNQGGGGGGRSYGNRDAGGNVGGGGGRSQGNSQPDYSSDPPHPTIDEDEIPF